MKSTQRCKSGMITVELAVSLVLIVVALFIALGLFGNNIQTMVSKSNFQNLFHGGSERTVFSFFNKDYSNNQINVQVMGEQGLEMLRQKANNNALELIPGVIASAQSIGSNGTPVPPTVEGQKDINTVAYLGLVIQTIVGNPSICNRMSEPSKAQCGANPPPATKYALNVGSTGDVTIYEQGTRNYVHVKSTVSTPYTPDVTGASPNDNVDNQFKKIGSLTNTYSSQINSSFALVSERNYFSSNLKTSQFENKVVGLLTGSDTLSQYQYGGKSPEQSLAEAAKYYEGCSDDGIDGAWYRTWHSRCWDDHITANDVKTYNNLFQDANGNPAGEIGTAIGIAAEKANAILTNNINTATTPINKDPITNNIAKLPNNESTNNWYKNLPDSEPVIAGSSTALLINKNNSDLLLAQYATIDTQCDPNGYNNTDYIAPVGCGGGGGGGGGGSYSPLPITETCVSGFYCSLGSTYSGITMPEKNIYSIANTYIETPLKTDDIRLQSVTTTGARAAVLGYYSNMLELIWNNNTLINILQRDGINNSCSIFVTQMLGLSKTYGLDNNTFLRNSSEWCVPGRDGNLIGTIVKTTDPVQ